MDDKVDFQSRKSTTSEIRQNPTHILYTVEETPPWYLSILLGFQHYLTAVGAMISVPLLLSEHFCMDKDYVGISQLIGTIFFVSGLCTLLQSTFGVRLPIVQGGTFTFVTPTIAILSQRECGFKIARSNGIPESNFTAIGLPEIGSDEHREDWMSRIREVQGAIMVASLFEVAIGFSGLMGIILKYIGPLSVIPTITLVGLSLFEAGSGLASKHWWIAIMTVVLITVFSQYLKNVQIPICGLGRKGCKVVKLPIFYLFPVLLGMLISWAICAILTETGALPKEEGKWGYYARTDTSSVMTDAPWIRFPYPGQWGLPTVTTAGVFGILSGVLAAMIESIGDYYACARLAGAPPPPIPAINRGIGMEGIGCVLAGAWGSGNGTTSYSENVGAIGITKVGSRRVVQVGGVLMMLLGCLGKFGALFTTIPDPVIGGMFIVAFGMATAVGLSNLQFIDLNSPRNIFILGISLYFGLCLPLWLQDNEEAIDTGSDIADQILTVLFSTSMFVGGLVGFVLDNTIPGLIIFIATGIIPLLPLSVVSMMITGTDEERGIHLWRNPVMSEAIPSASGPSVYDLPFQRFMDKIKLFRFIPFCPAFLKTRHRDSVNGGTDNWKKDVEIPSNDKNNVELNTHL